MHTTALAAAIAAVLAAAAVGLAAPPPAQGWVYTDVIDFNLTESVRYIGPYSISSSGDGSAYYRWLDDPDHTTVISGNRCSDGAMYGKAEIPAHNTSYHRLFGGSPYLCFLVGGRVAYGAGSMYHHDGRIRR